MYTYTYTHIIYIYIYIYTHIYVYIHIYIYVQRESERETEREIEIYRDIYFAYIHTRYIIHKMHMIHIICVYPPTYVSTNPHVNTLTYTYPHVNTYAENLPTCQHVSNVICIYGQFSKFHVCFCGLDPGNLKLETVRTNEQHICF